MKFSGKKLLKEYSGYMKIQRPRIHFNVVWKNKFLIILNSTNDFLLPTHMPTLNS